MAAIFFKKTHVIVLRPILTHVLHLCFFEVMKSFNLHYQAIKNDFNLRIKTILQNIAKIRQHFFEILR